MDWAAVIGALSALAVSIITGLSSYRKDKSEEKTKEEQADLDRDRLYLDHLELLLKEKDAMIELYRSEAGRLRALLEQREG